LIQVKIKNSYQKNIAEPEGLDLDCALEGLTFA